MRRVRSTLSNRWVNDWVISVAPFQMPYIRLPEPLGMGRLVVVVRAKSNGDLTVGPANCGPKLNTGATRKVSDRSRGPWKPGGTPVAPPVARASHRCMYSAVKVQPLAHR